MSKVSSLPRRPIAIAAAAVAAVAVIVIVVILVSGGSSSSSKAAPSGTSSTTSRRTTTTPAGPTTSAAPTSTSTKPPDPKRLPLVVTVSKTSGLHNGDTIKIHVVPTAGSDIYGIEARMCAEKADLQVETDFYPNQTGNCVLHPLSAGTDTHPQIAVGPPYQSADLTFKVGVGRDRYTTEFGQPVDISCGPGHPCQLVLLLQVPGGFGFQSYPVTFA